MDARELSSLACADFVAALGPAYEGAPWVAERAHEAGPFGSLAELAKGLKAVVAQASEEEQRGLLAACGGAAEPAEQSASRPSGPGVPAGPSAQEEAELVGLRAAYSSRFGFPFVLAAPRASGATLLAALSSRLRNGACAELALALEQVHRIAWLRLRELVRPNPTGFLTCHVLDTSRGCPASGMAFVLRRRDEASGQWLDLGHFVTNADGRTAPLIKAGELKHGAYELTFDVGEYFEAASVAAAGTAFLDQVPVRFGVDDPEAHYHVPLLCSPWSYSTYRGS